jgi:hypothetical protein
MMKHVIAAAVLLLGSVPAIATTVEVATGDWSNIPRLAPAMESIDSNAVAAIHESIESGECVIEGQRKGRLDMTVPFLIRFSADGTPERLIIEKLGCDKAEGILAGALVKLVDRGVYRPPGGIRRGWFRGQVSFSQYEDR